MNPSYYLTLPRRFPGTKIPTCGALRFANGTLQQVHGFGEISLVLKLGHEAAIDELF
jgi:hypothetical protein